MDFFNKLFGKNSKKTSTPHRGAQNLNSSTHEALSSDQKDKIKNLVQAGNLLEALNLIDENNNRNDIIILKASWNKLKKAGLDFSSDDYQNEMNRIKERIFLYAGLEEQVNKPFTTHLYTAELSERVDQIGVKIESLLMEHSSSILLLKRRFDRLNEKKNLAIIHSKDLINEVKKLEEELDLITQERNTESSKLNKKNIGTIEERIALLISKLEDTQSLKAIEIIEIRAQYSKLKKQRILGIIEEEAYTDKIDRLDIALSKIEEQ